MDQNSQAAQEIIKAQQAVIGPIALEQAKNTKGIKITSLKDLTISGDPREALSNLVIKYSEIFGQASVEVCKDAIRELKPPIDTKELPDILQ